MKKRLFLFLLIAQAINLSAGKIDKKLLHQLIGTKWELVGEKKYSKIFPKRSSSIAKETITFSAGTILFDLPDQHYACDYTLKNKFEMWLYCAEPDQYIYRVHVLTIHQLILDLLIKNKNGKLKKQRRLTYARITI